MTLSSYGIQSCAEINHAPCALLPTNKPNKSADADVGALEDPKPVRDPTETQTPIPSPKKQKLNPEESQEAEFAKKDKSQLGGGETKSEKKEPKKEDKKADQKSDQKD